MNDGYEEYCDDCISEKLQEQREKSEEEKEKEKAKQRFLKYHVELATKKDGLHKHENDITKIQV